MTTMSITPDPGYLAMPDAVNVNLLPVGYPAYLGYTDGAFATAAALAWMFPDANLVLLTVMAGTLGAHGARVAVNPGADTEPGDLRAVDAANWARRQIEAAPGTRPVIYASVQGVPGYGMRDVIEELGKIEIETTQVRLLSAHYGAGPHVCGPLTCHLIGWEMDGTQWTDHFATRPMGEGPYIDMSLLKPDFFQTQPVSTETETERVVRELGIVRQGDTGEAVFTVQGLCNARMAETRESHIPLLELDGVFGADTLDAVKAVQSWSKLADDGVVGPLTWPVLLGVA